MKRYSRLIAAGVIFLLLLAWALTQERGRKVEKGEAFGVDASVASKLEVKSEMRSITLEKTGDQWWVTAPIRGWADKEAAERMVKAIAELKPTGDRQENPADAKFGLDKPGLTATLTYGRKQAIVHLGNQLTGGSEYYARIEGRDRLYFVPASLHSDLTQDPESLRDKAITHLKKDGVVSVALQYPDHALTLEKRGTVEQPEWLLTQPYEAQADEWATKQITDKLIDLKAEGFAPEKPAVGTSYGFDKPLLKATLRTSDGKQSIITFGARSNQVIASASTPSTEAQAIIYLQVEGRPEVMMVADATMADLQKTDMDLRDKRILDFDREQVSELRVERKQGVSFTARRAGPDRWALAAPITEAANRDKINDLLWDLNELEAREFLGEKDDLKQFGLALPETVFTLTVKGQKDPVKVYVGYKQGEGAYYARTSQSNQIYVVADMLMQDLPKTVEDLKAAKETGAPAEGTLPSPTPPPPGS